MNFLRETDKAKKASTEFLDPLKQGQETTPRIKRFGRYSVTIISASLLVSLVAVAGSLTPPGTPASTMRTLQEIYDTVAGTFDSSAISSDPDGSVIQGLKYITENLPWSLSGSDIYNNNAGNVGIGTASPSKMFHVDGDVQFGGTGYGSLFPGFGRLFLRTDDGAGFQPFLLFQDLTYGNAMGFSFITDGTTAGTRMDTIDNAGNPIYTLTESGNVGIGTTEPSTDFVLHRTDSATAVIESVATISEAYSDLSLVTDDGAHGFNIWTNNSLRSIGAGPLSANFSLDDDAPIAFFTNGSERLRIMGNGNVGIGTTAPVAQLETRGTTGLITYSGAPYASFTADSQSYIDYGSNVFTSLNDSAVRASGLMGGIQDDTMTRNIIGTYGWAESTNSVLSTKSVVALNGDAYNSGSGGVTSVRGLVTYAAQFGSGPVGELTGIYLGSHDVGAGTGTVTNNFGLYIGNQTNLATNNYALYSEVGPVVVTASGSVGIGTANPTTQLDVIGNAFVSGDFEVDGVLYADGGCVGCGGTGGSAVGLREGYTGSFTNFSSVSFNAPHFVLDTGNPDARLSLDWGAGGPASLSQNETVTGTWTFSTNPTFSGGGRLVTSNSLDFDEFENAMDLDANTTITGGAFSMTFDHASVSSNFEVRGYASASQTFGSGLTDCDAESQTLNWDATTGRFSCLADASSGSGVASDSLDFDEFVDSMTLDANTTISNGGFRLTIQGASMSGNFDPTINDTFDLGEDLLRWRDIYLGPGSMHIGTSLADEYVVSYDTTSNYIGFNANGTGDPEVLFNSAGNVGIGTTTAGARLTVSGGATIGTTTAGNAISLNTSSGTNTTDIGTGTTTGAVTLGANLNDIVIDSADWDVTAAGAISTTGLLSTTGGLTTTVSPVNLNAGGNVVNIATSTASTGGVLLGNGDVGGTNTVTVNSSTWDITAAGAISTPSTLGVSGLVTLTGGLTTSVGVLNLNAGGNTVNIATTTASTGGVLIGNGDVAGTNTVTVNSNTWDITAAGAISGVTTLTMSGLLTLPGGLTTLTSPVNLNAGGNTVNIATTTASTGGVLIGNGDLGGTNTVTINSANFDVTAAGALTATSLSTPSLLTLTGGLTTSVGVLNLNAGGNVVNLATTTASTGGVLLGNGDVGGTNTVTVNSSTWDVTAAGAFSGITTLTMSGLLTLPGGLTTLTSPVNINAGGNVVNIATSTASTGGVLLGNGDVGGTNTVTVNSSTWDITAAGAISTPSTLGVSGLVTLTGGLTTSVGVLNLNAGGNTVNIATTTASTGGVLIGNGDVAGTNTVTVNSNTWDITAAGAISGVTTFSSSGLMTLTGGLTTNTGAVNINSGGNALNIGTGTQTGGITVGNGGETIAVNSSDWDISTTGLFTGVSGVDSTGAEALNLNNTATGDIVMAGGVGSTGCTLTNSTGAFSCAGNITTTATGTPTAGFWTRDTTSGYLYPSTIGDNVGIGDSSPAAKFVVGDGDDFRVDSTGHVFAIDGASGAGNLAYSFVSDTDTGLYHSAANEMRFQTGGTDKVTIASDGNVGIGTTTVTHKLRVEGAIYASTQGTATNEVVTAGRLVNTGTGMTGGGALTGDLTLSSTTWSASSGGNIFNLNAGNVGIGEDTPTSKLQVNGNTALGYAGAVTAPASGLAVSGGTALGYTSSPVAPANGLAVFGNVGIGSTAPTEKLNVVGNILATGDITAGGTVSGASLSGTCNLAGNVDVDGNAQSNVPVDFTDSNCADYAEVYPSSESVHPGDLLVLDTANPGKVKKASQGNSANIMGVVSTSPAAIVGNGKFISGQIASEYNKPNEPAVALIGRVPTKVSLENGPIAVGDRLTASSIPGVAMKATQSGQVVGTALEPMNSTSPGLDGKIMVFVSIGYWAPDVESLVSDTSLGIQISPTSILSYILDYLGDAILEVKKLVAGTVKTKNFEIEDSATGEIYCVRILNGEWDKQEGECSSAPAQNSTSSETPAEDPDTDTDPTAQGGEPLTESPSADESTSEETSAPEPESESASEPVSEPTSTTE